MTKDKPFTMDDWRKLDPGPHAPDKKIIENHKKGTNKDPEPRPEPETKH